MTLIIWHYNRCSKSRQTLQLLQDMGLTPQVRTYHDDPPSRDELTSVLNKLDLPPEAIVRKKDNAFKALNLDTANLEDSDWLDLLLEHPHLIERPIVITDQNAAIGRPPQSVLEIL